MAGVFEQTIEVIADHVDGNGHVNNVCYVQWMQDVAIAHAGEAGATQRTQESGATWVVRSHHVDYHRSARAGDQVRAQTWVATMDWTRSVRKYRFSRAADGVVLVTAATEWVYIDTASGRPEVIPGPVRDALPVLPPEQEPVS